MGALHAEGCRVDSQPRLSPICFGSTTHEVGGKGSSIGSTISDAIDVVNQWPLMPVGCGQLLIGVAHLVTSVALLKVVDN